MITFPEYARVGRIIAKENFYDKANATVKSLFQSEIARITWEYKLAPETINIPAKNWSEIQVFRIDLKKSDVPMEVLRAIDSIIPYPILFLIEKGTAEKAVICYKERGQKDENSARVDTYFETDWNDEKLDNIKIDGLNIDTVFSNFVRQIAGDKLPATKSQSIRTLKGVKDDVKAMRERKKIQRQIDALTRKINAEPSLGRRQELAEERYKLRKLL